MTSKSERLLELDVLRGASVIGVILIHIIGGSFHFWQQGSAIWTIFIILDQLFRVSVPLFVFISGYNLYSRYAHKFNLAEFLIKRVARLVPWYIIWSLIIFLYINLTVLPGYVNYPTWKLIFLGKVDYHLYFVSMIFQLYLLFPLLLWAYKKFRKNFVILLFVAQTILYLIFTLDGQKLIELPWRFYEQQQYLFFGTWLFYFVFGFFLSEKSEGSAKLHLKSAQFKWIKFVLPIATITFLGLAVHNSLHLITQTADTNVATRSTRIPLLLYTSAFITSALIYSDVLLKLKKQILKILLYFANVSYLVYLIHALVIRILGNFILPNSMPNLILFAFLVFTLSILLAQASLWVAARIPLPKLSKA